MWPFDVFKVPMFEMELSDNYTIYIILKSGVEIPICKCTFADVEEIQDFMIDGYKYDKNPTLFIGDVGVFISEVAAYRAVQTWREKVKEDERTTD